MVPAYSFAFDSKAQDDTAQDDAAHDNAQNSYRKLQKLSFATCSLLRYSSGLNTSVFTSPPKVDKIVAVVKFDSLSKEVVIVDSIQDWLLALLLGT